MTDEQETSSKDEMYNEMVKLGISPRDARTALELALHAKDQAIDTIKRVTSTSPPHLKTLVTGLAFDALTAGLEQPDVVETREQLLVGGIVFAALYCKERDAKEGESKPN